MKTKKLPRLIGKRASAGSGKTFALALRFIKLLSEAYPSPEHLRILGSFKTNI